MVISSTKLINSIQWLLTTFLIASFLLFDTYTWGKYSFIICTVLIFLLTVVKNRGKIRVRIEPFILLFLAFTAYVALTALWAITPSDTLTMARTLLRILVCFTLIYWAYCDEPDPLRMITMITAASYVVAFYSVFVYGFDNIIHSSDDILLNKTYTNINSFALFLAFGCICDLYLILYDRFRIYSIISVLSITIIAATQSRKAIVFLVLGALMLLVFRFSQSTSMANRILRIVTILFLVLIGIYFLSQLPIFVGVNNRIERMINTFTGSGKMDHSSIVRKKMIELGLFCWSKRPFSGIGMSCTHTYAAMNLQIDKYLHNNYVDLLAGGGTVAFVLYYAMYAYLIWAYVRLRKVTPKIVVFGIITIILLLITDYGRVTYYTKIVLYELMLLFLLARNAQVNRKDLTDDHEAD